MIFSLIHPCHGNNVIIIWNKILIMKNLTLAITLLMTMNAFSQNWYNVFFDNEVVEQSNNGLANQSEQYLDNNAPNQIQQVDNLNVNSSQQTIGFNMSQLINNEDIFR
jgi:hypothetical protein